MFVLEDHEESSLSFSIFLICIYEGFGSENDFGVSFCADPCRVAIVPISKAARMKGHHLEEVQLKRSLEGCNELVVDYLLVLHLEPEHFHLVAFVPAHTEREDLPFLNHKSSTLNVFLLVISADLVLQT